MINNSRNNRFRYNTLAKRNRNNIILNRIAAKKYARNKFAAPGPKSFTKFLDEYTDDFFELMSTYIQRNLSPNFCDDLIDEFVKIAPPQDFPYGGTDIEAIHYMEVFEENWHSLIIDYVFTNPDIVEGLIKHLELVFYINMMSDFNITYIQAASDLKALANNYNGDLINYNDYKNILDKMLWQRYEHIYEYFNYD